MAKRAARKSSASPKNSVSAIQGLAIDSNHEPITKSVFDYRETVVYPYLTSQGMVLTKLQGSLARRCYVVGESTQDGVQYITGVGHGFEDTYTGDYGEPIFQVGHYEAEEVRGKIVHLLACQAGRKLGPDFVKQGCLAFFGYDMDFTFPMNHNRAMFFECDSEIDKGFAEGLTAREVYERTIALFNETIAAFDAAGDIDNASLLETNRDHLRCPSSGGKKWGDTSARLR